MWALHQLDIINTFTHEDLLETFYIESSLACCSIATFGKLCFGCKYIFLV